MVKWATALVLVLVMTGTLLAGVPLHFGGHDCGSMECCETEKASPTSHTDGGVPGGSGANLYCFLSCPQPTLPYPSGTPGRVSPSVRADDHPVAVQPPMPIPVASLRRGATETHRQDSHPIYIRHLALLI